MGLMSARNLNFYCDFEHPWVRAQSFTDRSASSILSNEVDRNALIGEKPNVWLLDLDSTLFSTSPRTKAVFAAFIRSRQKVPFHWSWLLPQLNMRTQQYQIEKTFVDLLLELDNKRAKMWAEELWAEFRPFWREHFFGDRYLLHDIAHPQAVSFVHQIIAARFEVVYLTGRIREKSSIGTWQSLRQHGFPVGEGTHLLMKPNREGLGDLEFKEQAADVLAQRFEVRVSIDNEPENLEMFARKFKNAQIVFFHSVMSERLPQKEISRSLGGRPLYRIFSFD